MSFTPTGRSQVGVIRAIGLRLILVSLLYYIQVPRRLTPDDFWERKTTNQDGCWLYSGCVTRDGYGNLSFRGSSWLAHRLAWSLRYGQIPRNKCVLHRCDVPRCINHEHLFLGTQADNMADMKQKGRRKGIGLGESNGRAVLDNASAAAIRSLYQRGTSANGQVALARQFGVSQALVSMIIRGELW